MIRVANKNISYLVEFLNDETELSEHVIEIRVHVDHAIRQTFDLPFHLAEIAARFVHVTLSLVFDLIGIKCL